MKTRVTHEQLHTVRRTLETDYTDFGGKVHRWADGSDSYPDCSMGCRHAAWLEGGLGADWCVCVSPTGPRAGLLTFEHQAGFRCFEPKAERSRARKASQGDG